MRGEFECGEKSEVTGQIERRVLVVDDDERVRTVVMWRLEADGFMVTQAGNGRAAADQIAAQPPDLVVLDLSLPELDGLDVLRLVRRDDLLRQARLPVLVLSGRDGEEERITGLELGADDYLVKPFSPEELAARVRSVLRRSTPAPAAPGLRLDAIHHRVTVNGETVELTGKEFDLLAFLARHPRQVFTREQLLRAVWQAPPGMQSEATVTEHIHRLRHKVRVDPARPHWLRTVRGVGYSWEPAG
ncbi:response regulator transcription factor [Amycolatopsis cihanbeyliensis]|uniref:DNA-binding response OmpR family regulator n=1 Tax=Amycolatopsis cihanbeyliensis TaxID=1128664 RepID=A0A542DFL6_AMYCI|nr:response regulator transcription factor [Amycolatopsis cihanbeyliensis]TQJ01844.1 DNA-binding response OmpR family regulator [Amycolatopsis cihanbeyliensis]